MVNLETAEKALKTVYLGVVQDQLNTGVNPFLSKIEQTTSDIWGKEIIKTVNAGVNGGVGAGGEDGLLPTPSGNAYKQFRLDLKNLYGTIEISDKAIMASQNSSGAFVNLLNAEMDGLLKASKMNLGRMLFGDGSGTICKVSEINSNNVITVDHINCLMEGMVIDFYNKETNERYSNMKARRIKSIDRANKKITLDGSAFDVMAVGDYITMQNSKDFEICGLEALFNNKDLYGLKRSENEWLNPYIGKYDGTNTTQEFTKVMDYIESSCGSQIDYITTSYKVRQQYISYMTQTRMNFNYLELESGYKTVAFNGIPIVADRFCGEDNVYLLNSKDFKMHQLADWRWLEGDGGRVIKQKPGTPCYSATLVKYANIICDRPMGQAKLEYGMIV